MTEVAIRAILTPPIQARATMTRTEAPAAQARPVVAPMDQALVMAQNRPARVPPPARVVPERAATMRIPTARKGPMPSARPRRARPSAT